MLSLVAILWVLYLSECFVRWKPGDWIFREGISGEVRAVDAPDLAFANERFAFVWASLFPWSVVHLFSGDEMDRKRCHARLDVLRQESRWVKRSAAALFSVLLVIVPLLIVTGRLLPLLWWVLGALLVTWVTTFVTFMRAYRRVHGCAPVVETWLVLALSPIDLIRSPIVMSLRAAQQMHPVVAAEALCGEEEFLRVARMWHFDRPDLRPTIEQLAKRRDLGHRLAAPPADLEPGVVFYCQRCHGTFTGAATRCADCEGVALTRL